MTGSLTADRFRRALSRYDANAQAQHRIVERLIELAEAILPLGAEVDSVLEVGCGTGLLTDALLGVYRIGSYGLNDLCPEAVELVMERARDIAVNWHPRGGDAEHLFGPSDEARYRLIASSSTIQWLNDPHHFLSQAAHALCTDGVLLLSSFSSHNLYEFRDLTEQGLYYPSVESLRATLCNTGLFDSLSIIEEQIVLHFPSPRAVLDHLQATGVTGTASAETDRYWTPRRYERFCRAYHDQYGIGQGEAVQLTYSPIYIVGRRR